MRFLITCLRSSMTSYTITGWRPSFNSCFFFLKDNMLLASVTHLWCFTGVRWCLFCPLSSPLCSSCLELWSSRPSGQKTNISASNFFFAHISLCTTFDKIKRYKCCVIAVTPVRTIRLKRKLKMGWGLKMGPRELAVRQGKKPPLISTPINSRMLYNAFYLNIFLHFNRYFLAGLPRRILWRSQS